jgi:hypothetical protein
LFLDIEGAFQNAVTAQLLHNMCMHHIPGNLINLIEQVVTNGIRQGDPLPMILYIIYSSGLVDVAKPCQGRETLKELMLAFVDDMAFIAVARDFEEAHQILADMMEQLGGGMSGPKLTTLTSKPASLPSWTSQ